MDRSSDATVAALLVVIISSALKNPLEKLPGEWHGFSFSSIPCFFIASFFGFVLIKMVGLFEGMLSLHNLRAELVIESALRAAVEKKTAIQSSAGSVKPILPDGYGAIVDQPK